MEQANPIIQWLGAIGLGSILTGVIAAIAGRKLTQANTGAKIVESADTQIENLEKERDYFRNDRDAERSRANREATKNRGWWERADRMMVWVRRQEQRNNDNAIDDPAPRLYPLDTE